MSRQKLNGFAKWIIVALAVGGMIYNTIVTRAVTLNDIKHLKTDMADIKQDVRDLRNLFLDKK